MLEIFLIVLLILIKVWLKKFLMFIDLNVLKMYFYIFILLVILSDLFGESLCLNSYKIFCILL